MSLESAIAKLAEDLTDTDPAAGRVTARIGTVASYSGGVMTVTVGADQLIMRRPSVYTTPAVGDQVVVLVVNNSPVCITSNLI